MKFWDCLLLSSIVAAPFRKDRFQIDYFVSTGKSRW